MKVVFESREPRAAELRALAEHRVRVVMRRLTWLVPTAKVHMSDVNGPRGGVDKRCKVEFDTDSSGRVVVTSLARDWRSALDAALLRAARALVRLWRRGHQRRPGRGLRAGSAFGHRPQRALAWNEQER